MAGVADLISLREQLSGGGPALPYVPPPPAPAAPSYSPLSPALGGGFGGAPTGGARISRNGLDVSPDEDWIIKHESGWNTGAYNNTPVYSGGKLLGHAFGLGQLVDTNRQSYARQLGISNPNTTDAREQLAMMRLYIQQRYGNAANAHQFWLAHNWY